MKTADRYPDLKDGFIIIDDRQAPTLSHALYSRIWRTRRAAESACQRSKTGLARLDAQHLCVVPVDGPNGVFALDYIDATGVVVATTGRIRMEIT